MRIVTTISEVEEKLAFVKKAADAFSKNKEFVTFGNLKPGAFLAIQWGIHGRAILVVKLGDEEPVVFGDSIPMEMDA